MTDMAWKQQTRSGGVSAWLWGCLAASGLAFLAAAALLLTTQVFGDSAFTIRITSFGPGLAQYQEPSGASPSTEGAGGAPVQRITIPRYGVDAPVIGLGVDQNGVMEIPNGPWDVAWYDFTAPPGGGSNAVFAGHVDWTFESGPAGAVFWHLKDLVQGDQIEVVLEDGTVLQYSVTSRELVDPAAVDFDAIVGPTAGEVVTLITCGGTFNTATGHYTGRTIVRAERVD